MKRVLAALAALCLLASGVSAKGLVIIASTTGNNANFANGMRPMENQWLSTLRGLGANFDVIRADQLTAPAASFNATIDAYLRQGKVWKNGIGVYSANGDSLITTYDPIIHLGYSSSDANMTTPAGRYRADSLTLVAYYPTVTHLFVANSNHTNNCFNTVANRCSLGTTTVASPSAISYSAHHDSTLNVYEVGNPSRTWKSYIGYQVNTTRTPKGWRPILGMVTTRRNEAGAGTNNYDFPDAASVDAINGGACAYRTNPDTVALWSILNRDATGAPIGGNAKPMFFCGTTRVSNATDFDMGIMLTAIALIDSASGGGLLSGSTAIPKLVGIHIDDGWKRGDSNQGSGGGGISPTDTTALKASIDSLAALNVPFVVGVEVDSIGTVMSDTMATAYTVSDNNGGGSSTTLTIATAAGTFPTSIRAGMYLYGTKDAITVVSNNGATLTLSNAVNLNAVTCYFYDAATIKDGALMDTKWWARAPLAHFTPHCHEGVSSSGSSAGVDRRAQNVSSKFLRPIDIWGVNYTRSAWGSVDSTLAYGLADYAMDVADTMATYWLSKRAFAMLDSVFGSGRVDHLVMAPVDDWTNSRVTHNGTSAGNPVDSIMAAVALSGGTGVRANAFSPNSAVIHNASGNSGYGYYINQQPWTVRGSGVPTWVPVARYGASCNVLSCAGYQNTTNSVAPDKGVGSSRSWSSCVRGQVGYYSNTLRGLFGGPFDEGQWSGSATMGQNIRVNIQALHVGDLGSRQPATGGELTRPGFYNLKYLVNSVKMANAHARTPLVMFAYPDGMQP